MDYGGLYLQRGLQSPNLAHGGPSPNTFLGGYRVPAIESRAGAGTAASEANSLEFLVPPWLPGQSILPWFSALPWLPELSHGSPDGQSCHASLISLLMCFIINTLFQSKLMSRFWSYFALRSFCVSLFGHLPVFV